MNTTASPSISLGQVEDELREAEAYLFQEAPKKETLTDIALPTMTEARRKEIIAKLNSERAALRQRKTAPPSADDDRTSSTSFLDATAFFPLPSLHQHSFESPSQFNSIDDKRCGGDSRDGNDGAYSGDEDDGSCCSILNQVVDQALFFVAVGDDSMYFLKELERSDGNDKKTKVAQDMATLTSTCSFRPAQSSRAAQTLKTPEKARRSKATAHSKPPPSWSPHKKAKVDELTERLHVEGALRFELREKVKQVLDDQRKEMLRQLEHAIEAESQLTFTPTINAHSHKLTHDMTKMDVTDRLVQDAEDTAEKKLQVQAYYAALLDFVARQQLLHAQMEQKFEAKLALEERIQAEEKPFQPCIGNSNQVLQYTRPKRLVESTQAQLYRMTYEVPSL
ncbi:hypothetical protein B5M09_005255 [Aphanomyces astaci]|uniref:Uncharacterized protein n=1 Tax=Aphanomyces astaci TaxID=112090 RepID=A0A425DPB9_APHAT|nr:hypothetical protein B5M09_005255 [Aphanomyces astaci]